MTRTEYIFGNGYFSKAQDRETINHTQTQPDVSGSKNCTAAMPNHYTKTFLWIAIHCDKKFEATYICQRSSNGSMAQGQIMTGQTCDKNWLALNGTDKCFF